MLDNRKIGELPEINGKLVKVRDVDQGQPGCAVQLGWPSLAQATACPTVKVP